MQDYEHSAAHPNSGLGIGDVEVLELDMTAPLATLTADGAGTVIDLSEHDNSCEGDDNPRHATDLSSEPESHNCWLMAD